MEITRNRAERTINLKQTKYINNMLEKYNKINLNPISTPVEPGIKLNKNENQASKEDIN